MNVETIDDDWIHKWFNLFDGGLGYFWCGCLAMVAVVLRLCVVLAKHSKTPE